MADDARVLALKRIETLVAKARALQATENGAEEARTCAALVLRIIETHGFKIVDPTPKVRRSLMADLLKDMDNIRVPVPSESAGNYTRGVTCLYCKKHIMFREAFKEVPGGAIHEECEMGYEAQRNHYKR